MTEVMPVPRNLNFTVLPAGNLTPAFSVGDEDRDGGESNSIQNQQAIRFVTAENKDCPYRLHYVRKGRWQLP